MVLALALFVAQTGHSMTCYRYLVRTYLHVQAIARWAIGHDASAVLSDVRRDSAPGVHFIVYDESYLGPGYSVDDEASAKLWLAEVGKELPAQYKAIGRWGTLRHLVEILELNNVLFPEDTPEPWFLPHKQLNYTRQVLAREAVRSIAERNVANPACYEFLRAFDEVREYLETNLPETYAAMVKSRATGPAVETDPPNSD